MTDIRYALRLLWRQPAFSLIAILTIGIAIGANTAIFSTMYAVLFRSLPFAKPERLVFLYSTNAGRGVDRDVTSVPEFEDWRDQSTAFEHVAAMDAMPFNLTTGGEPARVIGGFVSWSFFDLLGVKPAIGRAFQRGEDEPGAERVAILGHALWADRFDARPDIVGRAVMLNDRPYTVVGVMPRGFRFPEEAELWVPADYPEPQRRERQSRFLPVIARLELGATVRQAAQQVDAITRRNEMMATRGWGATAMPLREVLVQSYRTPVLLLFVAVNFVLLVACANVGNLLLSRAAARGRELAIRAALGGTRARLVRQLLVESVTLALAGAALGVLIGGWSIGLLVAMSPVDLPPWLDIRLDLPVLLYTAGAAVVAGLAFGAGPAILAAGGSLQQRLGAGTRDAASGAGGQRAQRWLVVAEVACALVLLVGAGLMIRTLGQLVMAPLGFSTERIAVLDMSLPSSRYPTPDHRRAFYVELVERLRALPGMEAVSGSSTLPLSGIYEDTGSILITGQPVPPLDQPLIAGVDIVLPGYFDAMDIARVGGGRDFDARDTPTSPRVAIVNEVMAERFWKGENPVGRTFTIGRTNPNTYEVIDIVRSLRRANLGTVERPHFYLPFVRIPRASMSLVLKTTGRPGDVLPAVRNVVRTIDPLLPVASLQTLESYTERAAGLPRFIASLLSIFAALALLLAALGIYGVLSYAVTRRRAEIGVRVALGAERRDVLSLVARQGMGLVLVGLVTGLAASLMLTRLLRGVLYNVQPTDPLTLVVVSLLLLVVALAACYLPARRAARIDPAMALRTE